MNYHNSLYLIARVYHVDTDFLVVMRSILFGTNNLRMTAGASTEVFGDAIRCRATTIIVAQNHPSGNLTPSPEDRDVTRRLRQAGELLGIKVLDHLIFSEEEYLSMLEQNIF